VALPVALSRDRAGRAAQEAAAGPSPHGKRRRSRARSGVDDRGFPRALFSSAGPLAYPNMIAGTKGAGMNWTELIGNAIEYHYQVATNLMDLVDEDKLAWRPQTGQNWMTTGQLLKHISDACGAPMRGFVTGDWGLPAGVDMKDLPPEQMMPPAEKLPAVTSVAEARQLLAKDKQTALAMLEQCSETDLTNKIAKAPWDPMELKLGQRLLQMVEHLSQHKAQLFYYLKLQGKPVNTGHLWGM
jgi:uncharacterized damage-inducible protein DinB